jgi:hypothetical protein
VYVIDCLPFVGSKKRRYQIVRCGTISLRKVFRSAFFRIDYDAGAHIGRSVRVRRCGVLGEE